MNYDFGIQFWKYLAKCCMQGSNETTLTINLPGTKNIDKVENQEPKAYQEYLKFVKQEPKPDPVSEPGSLRP